MGGKAECCGRAVRADLHRGPDVRRSAGGAPGSGRRGRASEARALQGGEPGGEALAHAGEAGVGDTRGRAAHRGDPARAGIHRAASQSDARKGRHLSEEAKIESRKEGAIGWLVFSNPARRNAVSIGMWQAIPRVLEDFAADREIRVVVLTGAGDKAFVSGADISQF